MPNEVSRIFSKNRVTPFYGTLLDSRFRWNDGYSAYFVVPVKAGIQETHHHLLRCYNENNLLELGLCVKKNEVKYVGFRVEGVDGVRNFFP